MTDAEQRIRSNPQRRLFKLACTLGLFGLMSFLIGAIDYRHLKFFGLIGTCLSVGGYFSLVLYSYKCAQPFRARDGSKVTIEDNPILYRLWYFLFGLFGLVALVALVPYFLRAQI
jgi:hypothetical protein